LIDHNKEVVMGRRIEGMENLKPGLVDLFTAGDAAAILGVPRKRIYEWVDRGVLPHIQIGLGRTMMRIRTEDLERFIEEEFVPSSPPGHGGRLRRDLEE
jgi:excisionase family DNA binding protein